MFYNMEQEEENVDFAPENTWHAHQNWKLKTCVFIPASQGLL
jgi:hypothetical protein